MFVILNISGKRISDLLLWDHPTLWVSLRAEESMLLPSSRELKWFLWSWRIR